jgi:5-formyltetrahydrofolate cyclo-ligase
MQDITTKKADARKTAFARRAAAHTEQANQAGNRHLLDFLTRFRGEEMSGYMAIRTEIDPLAAMSEMAKYGPVGVPVIIGPGLPLEFHRWEPDIAMIAGPFGARVPINAEAVVPKVIVMPLAAFDRSGSRLGYGGGFYDRTLELLRRSGPVMAIGFAYSAQEFEQLPVEPTDQKLDAVVTESGVITI